MRQILWLTLAVAACNPEAQKTGAGRTAAEQPTEVPDNVAVSLREVFETPQDSIIADQRLTWAREQGLDKLPIGETMVALGRTFVGSPYVPGLLEQPPTEQLVVNLREFDCVTFVESVLALARTVKKHGNYHDFKLELQNIRYRGGELSGYPSRLHYFSEWIADNEAKGIVRNVTREIGGTQDTEPINFMSANVQAYRQLKDTAILNQILETEARLSNIPRYYIPKDRIADVASRIEDGDIIAATSTRQGLDIAHTGLAIRVNGELHLMHAPLVGDSVEISKQSLAERIKGISAQDGIIVARPVDVK